MAAGPGTRTAPAARLALAAVILLACLAAAGCWRVYSATWDEPEHLAAGIQLFDLGLYEYDTEHPPLGRLFLAAGVRRDDMRSGQWTEGTPLVAAECSFRRASQTGEKLLIESHVEKFGRSSFTIRHVFRDASGEIAAEGTETRIWARKDGNARSLKAVPIPEDVKKKLMSS